MNFKSLVRLIESADESAFYDVALFFLEATGYPNPRIVDGPYDGGRDVICDRSDVRIQLSVQREWQKKVEREAATAIAQGISSMLFVTNRRLTPVAREKFQKHSVIVGKSKLRFTTLKELHPDCHCLAS